MYTRCPECRTSFRVGAHQLQQAAGRVRCGVCGAAFNALATLHEGPAGPPTDGTASPVHAPSATVSQSLPGEGGADATARRQPDDTPDTPATADVPDALYQHRFDDDFGIDDLVRETDDRADTSDSPQESHPDARDTHAPHETPRDTAGAASDDDFSDVASLLLDETGGFDLDALWDERSARGGVQGDGDNLPTLNDDGPARTDTAPAPAESGSAAARWPGDDRPPPEDDYGPVPADDEDTARHRWRGTPLEALRNASVDDPAGDAAEEVPATDVPRPEDRVRAVPGGDDTPAPGTPVPRPHERWHAVDDVTVQPESGSDAHAGPAPPAATDGVDATAQGPADEAAAGPAIAEPGTAGTVVGEHRRPADAVGTPAPAGASGADAQPAAPASGATDPDTHPHTSPAESGTHAWSASVAESVDERYGEADDDVPHALETDAAQPPARSRTRHWWTAAAGIALLALAAQGVHHFRHELAAHPTVGPWVGALYDAVGLTVQPAWPLEAFELQAGSDAGRIVDDVLHIGADLRNRQQRPMPLPLLRVTLLDRWGEPVGHRVFAPAEYAGAQARAPLRSGDGIEARIAVHVDDAAEVYGFRLDVCRRAGNGALVCH